MSSWLDTLKSHNVQIDNAGHAIIASPQSASTTITPLTHLGIFDVIGPDALSFLQGQLSCDLNDVAAGQSRLGSHCNIKGSMVSLSRLIAVEDGFWLRTTLSTLAQGQANLKKYMMFSKSESQDISAQIVGLGIQGEQAAQLLASLCTAVPEADDQCVATHNGVLVKEPGERFELWLPVEEAQAILPKLLKQAALSDSNSWQLADIRQGIPSLQPETLETFIPQMTNLQIFGGVSFSKGCYTGQEIITRLQHRGKLKRPMFRLSADIAEPPVAGTSLSSADRDGIGTVVAAAKTEDGRVELLAVMLKDSFDDNSQKIHLESSNGAVLNRLDLPYELDPELFESKR
ncbi:MAG: folate-binding protein [Amphritea sp.]